MLLSLQMWMLPVKVKQLLKRANLIEALTLFFEITSAGETDKRLKGEVYITNIEVAVG